MAVSFIKRGAEARQEQKKEEARREHREANREVQRFYIPKGDAEERTITFLDGKLGDDGLLEAVTFYEHQLQLNGDWKNWFVCIQDNEPCPICAMPRSFPHQVFLFTIIDHTPYEFKGKTFRNQKRLFACKGETLARLQKSASGNPLGLTGLTFGVQRVGGDLSPSVGSEFEQIGNRRTMEELAAKIEVPVADLQPYNYDEVIKYRTRSELLTMGIGRVPSGIGSADAPQTKEQKEAATLPKNIDQML